MQAEQLVNAFSEALTNATTPTREQQAVGRLLTACQRCDHWQRGCTRQDDRSWVSQLITPGRVCPF